MKRSVFAIFLLLVLATQASALVDQKFQIQGVMTSNEGVVLPDGDYSVLMQIYDAPTGGLLMWDDTVDIIVENGVFTALLSGFYESTFERDNWIQMTVEGEAPMVPRIPIHPVPAALSATTVDPTNAVVGLNGKKGSVNLVGGTNVTVVPSSSSNEIIINATGGATGDDGDWTVTGEDISRAMGRVFVGMDAVVNKDPGIPPLRGEDGTRDPATAKMTVAGSNEGIYSWMIDDNPAVDGKAAIFGRRDRNAQNDGTGFGVSGTNTAVTGYNDWGDSYSFGVAGYTWFDFNNTGGVIGSRNSGDYWGSLGFRDGNGSLWGMYTPNSLHVGATTETSGFRMPTGATAGYILTTDASGNASWSPPAAATNDGDWTISGTGLYHTGYGAVALGTSTPINFGNNASATTMQIRAPSSPTLALDTQYASYTPLYRWTMTGGTTGLRFNKTSDYASQGTTALHLDEGLLELNRATGEKAIVLEGDGVDAYGPSLQIYSTSPSTTVPLISLDPQASSSNFGGNLTLRNGLGQAQVVIEANYNNTNVGRVTTPVLEITGGSDLSEQFDIGNSSALTQPGMVVSIDPENPGGLTLSGKAYDRRVAGVISGAGGVNTGMVMGQRGTVADGELPVALVGRVFVWADASDGPIEPGDLLTTSDRPGHAMKVTDHQQATGAILGKAMTGLSEGQGLILTLVTLQ